jgi:hypothetical protein
LEKFGILPRDIQKLFIHTVSLAEAAAESTEDTIEKEQKNVRGFLKISDKKQGMALVHTQGRFTEDGKDLIEAVKEHGSFIGILVDYDAVGSEIPKAARTKTPIIGINRETITWLQQNGYEITIAEVQEEYTPSMRVKDLYLQRYRIELDSVAQKVGAEGLWATVRTR